MDHDVERDDGGFTSELAGQDGRLRSGGSDLAAATTFVAELLSERLDLRPGQIVLDVATGSGNGALAAARRGCRAYGVDRVPDLLERARERARAERLPARFQLGEAQALPFPDASFDVVLSVFGATLAVDAQRAATELLRVCRPGGTIALTSWTAGSFIGAMFWRTGRQTGLDRQWSGLSTWGTENGIRSLLSGRVRTLVVRPRKVIIRCASSEDFLELMQIYYRSALSSLPLSVDQGDDAMASGLRHVVRRFNRADDGSLVVPSNYLEVVATKS